MTTRVFSANLKGSGKTRIQSLIQRADVLSPTWQKAVSRHIEEGKAFLEGYKFASAFSRSNAADAFLGTIYPGGFLPAAVITGPPRSGKTCFVRELLKANGHRYAWPKLLPKTEAGIRRELESAIGFVWFDSPVFTLHSPSLEHFIYTGKIPVFLSGAEIKLGTRLQSISRFIQLEAF